MSTATDGRFCGFVDLDICADVVQLLLQTLAQVTVGKSTQPQDIERAWVNLKINCKTRIKTTANKASERSKPTLTRLADLLNAYVEAKQSKWSAFTKLFTSKAADESETNTKTREIIKLLERDHEQVLLQQMPTFATEVLQDLGDGRLACLQQFAEDESAKKSEHWTECPFRPLVCEHKGCTRTVSYLHLKEHDQQCQFKIIPCPNGCDYECVRGVMSAHLEGSCVCKPIPCPYRRLGKCNTVPQNKLEAHLLTHCNHHIEGLVSYIDTLTLRGQKIEQRIYDANDRLSRFKDQQFQKHLKDLGKMQKKISHMESDLTSTQNKQMKQLSKVL